MKPTKANRDDKLKKIRDQVVGLEKSPLYTHRIQKGFVPVIGEGNHQAEIMFVAEAPGYYEAKLGHPFQGASGRVFDQLISSINIRRSDIYITNIIKDKLPSNRDPNPQEIEVYASFLIEQIKIIQPIVIVTLGKFSTNYIFNFCHLKSAPLSKIHGQSFEVICSYGKCHLLAMFHPAAGLYNPDLIPIMKQDITMIKKLTTVT